MTEAEARKLDALIQTLCTRCGRCCLNESYMGNLSATAEDVDRWEAEGRYDILRYESIGDLWIKNGEECTRCPFLRKDRGAERHKCRIHDTKPEECRGYPYDYEQMVQDGCEIVGELERLGIDATGWVTRSRRQFRSLR
jgi:Fe-S-cluster containining protein